MNLRENSNTQSGHVNHEMLHYNPSKEAIIVAYSNVVACFKIHESSNSLNQRLELMDRVVLNCDSRIVELAYDSNDRIVVNCGDRIYSVTLSDQCELEVTNHDELLEYMEDTVQVKKVCVNRCQGLSHEVVMVTEDDGKQTISLVDTSTNAIFYTDLPFKCCNRTCEQPKLSCLYMTNNHPRIVYANDRHSMALIDPRIRNGNQCVELFQSGEKNGHLMAFEELVGCCEYTGRERQHIVLSYHQLNLVDERYPKISVLNLSSWLDTSETNRSSILKSFNIDMVDAGNAEKANLIITGNRNMLTLSTLKKSGFEHILTPESLHCPIQGMKLTDSYNHYVSKTGKTCAILEERIRQSALTGVQVVSNQSGAFSIFSSTNNGDIFLQDFIPKEAIEKYDSWSFGYDGSKTLDQQYCDHLEGIINDIAVEKGTEAEPEASSSSEKKSGRLKKAQTNRLRRKGSKPQGRDLESDETLSCSGCEVPSFGNEIPNRIESPPRSRMATRQAALSQQGCNEMKRMTLQKVDQKKSSSSSFVQKFETLFGPSSDLKNRIKHSAISEVDQSHLQQTLSSQSPLPEKEHSNPDGIDSEIPGIGEMVPGCSETQFNPGFAPLPTWNQMSYKLIQGWNDESIQKRIPVEVIESLEREKEEFMAEEQEQSSRYKPRSNIKWNEMF